jgi:hypothetical protein
MTNCVTIGMRELGRLQALADVHQKVKREIHQYRTQRTWLRDEEAVSVAESGCRCLSRRRRRNRVDLPGWLTSTQAAPAAAKPKGAARGEWVADTDDCR